MVNHLPEPGSERKAILLDVLIVGGGISGLVTAFRLLVDRPKLDLQVVEAAGRLGGVLGTENVKGFLFERGPNGFLDNVPQTLELAGELGLEARLLSSSPGARKRYLYKRGKLHALPLSPLEFLRSPILSIGGKLRVCLEPLQPRGAPEIEDSVATFGRRRLGVEATAAFLDPLVTGVYAGDVERVSLRSGFPRLAATEKEHGSLFRGLRAHAKKRRRLSTEAGGAAEGEEAPDKKETPSGLGGKLHSFSGGLEELAKAMGDRLGDRVKLEAPVERIRKKGTGFEVWFRDRSALLARTVVVAIPAPRAASLFSSWNHDLANALEEIPYVPVAVVCLGFLRANVGHPLDGFGFLAPRNQGLRTLGVIWASSIFPQHAPEGSVSLRAMVGGALDPEVVGCTSDELCALVLREVASLLDLRGEPVARKVYRYPQGIPQYNVGHSKRLRRLEGWLKDLPGLFLAGNAYHGVGINDCVLEGGRIAREAGKILGQEREEERAGTKEK